MTSIESVLPGGTSLSRQLIENALAASGVNVTNDVGLMVKHTDECRRWLAQENTKNTIDGKVTGTIVESFCRAGLAQALGEKSFTRFGKKEEWIGDFNVRAYPVALIVSCKSMKAKERLIASGSSSLYVPTVGYGWFDDPAEFREHRCASYRLAGFNAIYMPQQTLDGAEGRNTTNAFGRPLLRSINDFVADFDKAIIKKNAAAGKGLVHSHEL